MKKRFTSKRSRLQHSDYSSVSQRRQSVPASQVVRLLQVLLGGQEQVLEALLEHPSAEARAPAASREVGVEVEVVAGVADGVQALVEAKVEGAAACRVVEEGAAFAPR